MCSSARLVTLVVSILGHLFYEISKEEKACCLERHYIHTDGTSQDLKKNVTLFWYISLTV